MKVCCICGIPCKRFEKLDEFKYCDICVPESDRNRIFADYACETCKAVNEVKDLIDRYQELTSEKNREIFEHLNGNKISNIN